MAVLWLTLRPLQGKSVSAEPLAESPANGRGRVPARCRRNIECLAVNEPAERRTRGGLDGATTARRTSACPNVCSACISTAYASASCGERTTCWRTLRSRCSARSGLLRVSRLYGKPARCAVSASSLPSARSVIEPTPQRTRPCDRGFRRQRRGHKRTESLAGCGAFDVVSGRGPAHGLHPTSNKDGRYFRMCWKAKSTGAVVFGGGSRGA